ncbi:MAG: hypothetical protein NTX72_01810 [Candidatus Uhrbacteria bacterium]|nr:hypothetical protein [Candidatus Uhrbacteria bacterium]
MKDQLKRILNLVQKTGDTMIVTDPNGDDVYVVMGLDQYENLRNIDVFEPEQEIDELEGYRQSFPQGPSAWGDMVESDELETVGDVIDKNPDIWSVMKPAGEEGETWDLAKLSENEAEDLEEKYKKYAQEPVASVFPEVPAEGKTEEITPKLAENEDEFGEEQFYLEPIE